MLQQGDRLEPCRCRFQPVGIIGRQQLHQGGGDLLGSAARPAGLEGMPLAIVDHQLPLQLPGQIESGVGPAGRGGSLGSWLHWTRTPEFPHPGGRPSAPAPLRLLPLIDPCPHAIHPPCSITWTPC